MCVRMLTEFVWPLTVYREYYYYYYLCNVSGLFVADTCSIRYCIFQSATAIFRKRRTLSRKENIYGKERTLVLKRRHLCVACLIDAVFSLFLFRSFLLLYYTYC